MSRVRSPNRDKAFEIYKEHGGRVSSKEIADLLNEKVSNINSWRSQDTWKYKLKGRAGAPKGNKNALGNKGGAPEKNQNRYKHGFYSKYLPKQAYDIFEAIEEMSPLEILWNNIKMKYAAIIRSQKIMHVKSKSEMIKELKKSKVKTKDRSTEKTSSNESEEEFEYEFQFAWDRQATFLRAQSDAMRTLSNMIKQYDEMLHKNWDLATEEQKARIEVLKAKLGNTEGSSSNVVIVDDIDD
ncbi:phage terminase small subunit [Clostridium intestinale]|uniref:PBSX phage terminase small subunit-like N-terminal domain-containing protein n=1 Tax=Clostridium intestinale TaxID=36845 RepID=A0A7D6VXK3_9CLOT|nr:phage terminase small subunit [Clostridium intestinale]QLY78051.1 hypothetical protein HZF06_13205 [Clostridium intestinale]